MGYQPQYDHRRHYKLGDITHFGGCEYECVDEENQYFVNNTYIPRPPRVKSPELVGEDSLKVPENRPTREGPQPFPFFVLTMAAVAVISALIGYAAG